MEPKLIKEGSMYYIGVDYHKKYSYMVVKDQEGNLKDKGTVNNLQEEVEEFLYPYRCGKAVIEATRNWGVMYNWLEELLEDVALAHPLKVKAIASARIKTDKISADVLCDLLRTNLLPQSYVPKKETREAKNILRQRMFLVRLQTMVKNRIYDMLDRHPEITSQAPNVSDLFGPTGMKWLNQVELPGSDNSLLSSELELLRVVRQIISKTNGLIKDLAKDDKRITLLRSIPGLGPFFAVLVAMEIDDITRFCDEKKLCSYAGLVPSTYASGGKVFHGRITKTGNKWLRWAIVEAVAPAVNCDSDIKAYYYRLKTRKGANAAKVATGRRLLTIIYRVLTQERFYRKNIVPDPVPVALMSS
jgi:transposase